jgi:hypothetical protein
LRAESEFEHILIARTDETTSSPPRSSSVPTEKKLTTLEVYPGNISLKELWRA